MTGAFILLFGQGQLKGFATVLMIGIVTSFFSAVYISRVIVEFLVRKGDETNFSFESPIANLVRKRGEFNFIGNRYKAYAFSGSIMVIGFVIIAFQSLYMGFDFKCGRSYF